MNSGNPNDASEQTFVLFVDDHATLAIPSQGVLQIRAATAANTSPGTPAKTTRVLVLRGRAGQDPLLLPVQGELNMVTIPRAQVAELPRLCRAADGVTVAVALEEGRILFLIVDPIAFLQTQRSSASPMEPP